MSSLSFALLLPKSTPDLLELDSLLNKKYKATNNASIGKTLTTKYNITLLPGSDLVSYTVKLFWSAYSITLSKSASTTFALKVSVFL